MKKINKFRFTFFLLGFCITALLVLGAFRIRSYKAIDTREELIMYDSDDFTPILLHMEPPVKEEKKEKPVVMKTFVESVKMELVDFVVVKREVKNDPPARPPKPLPGVNFLPEPPDNTIYSYHHEKAEFPGGKEALHRFIQSNVLLPDEAIRNDSYGRVYVKFVVEKDGSVSHIEILKDEVGFGAGREAIRVISHMPKWTPAKINGHFVRTWFVQPINFTY